MKNLKCFPTKNSFTKGFTLVELLVVLAAMGLLLSIAAPRYTEHVDRSRETVLRHNIKITREAIDNFHADRARYPKSLQELVEQHYLRDLPLDPITDRNDTWILMLSTGDEGNSGVFDVHSGAQGKSKNGVEYKFF